MHWPWEMDAPGAFWYIKSFSADRTSLSVLDGDGNVWWYGRPTFGFWLKNNAFKTLLEIFNKH